ncbi:MULTISPECIES: peptidase M14 [unclassified Halomonas]|uniref:peptidase M14 n=1 Tax=unclassified Halomonas TaxID=2609666 RepID=UPI001CF147E3|nr:MULTISPECIES: peptidase M14 [unclassified Halomonas]MCA8865564.1 peptidase M14 [Halomonas sp. SBBP1]UZH10423.1 peptidase M14 [Halomonas sp. BDJS001]
MTNTPPTEILLERSFPRTTNALLDEYAAPAYQGYLLEAWVFDDEAERQATETAFKAAGISARLRSAYKPLVHFFLEEFSWASLQSLVIEYPVLAHAPRRFLLEAYPLAALLPPGVSLRWEVDTTATTISTPFYYRVRVERSTGEVETYCVEAPNRQHLDHVDEAQCSPCGWLRLISPSGEVSESIVETDFEALFQAAMATLSSTQWQAASPYFEELNFTVHLPCSDRRLVLGDEHISLAEALHEELYFSSLEYFQRRAGLALGDRSIQPGQIVPEVSSPGEQAYLKVSLRPLDASQLPRAEVELESAQQAIGVEQIEALLAALGGQALQAKTRAGRAVEARYIVGGDRAVMISAGQHANETSGVVGALRAARQLDGDPEAHFVISPLENPDGYALQGRLVADQPRHMHHAARYTAFGNDLQSQPLGQPFEHAIREQAFSLSNAGLNINLHGYPAHEWTRPLSGYVPRGFEMWTIPKGFFLIMRYQPGYETAAEQLVEAVTQQLAQVPGLVEFNAAQIALFEIHAGALTFPMLNGFPYLSSEDADQLTPLMLITEYPDETLTGEPFVQAHTAQMATVVAAYNAFQTLSLSG